MDPPALNSLAATSSILSPPRPEDGAVDLRIADNRLETMERTTGNVIAMGRLEGEKYPDNSFNINPPPMLSTANLDWIGVYPIDFNDLTSGYEAYVYAPSGKIKQSESINNLDEQEKHRLAAPVLDTLHSLSTSNLMSSPPVVVNAGMPSEKIFTGKISSKFLEDLAGRIVQLMYKMRMGSIQAYALLSYMQFEHKAKETYFGPKLKDAIKFKLFSDVEGHCSGKYGFIIAVTNIEHIGDGMLPPGRGYVRYPITFRAIVFRPFKGEVLDAIVKSTNKIGVFAEAGPLNIFISKHSIPQNIKFEGLDVRDENEDEDDDNMQFVQIEDVIRVRIIGLRVDSSDIFAVGTLMAHYLGPCT
ncbi:DNA-directed RNA polymerase II subunit RPB7 [Cichlidogyrus casuarinus]|uniref:DNA-directed RNA polymerase II subunit RPB7 n=1 Tax=Cichlidogyrus casuarinus TaxID=1844966 RepID=A0ABD2QKD4_9PLAT